jgi:hypothetical protein
MDANVVVTGAILADQIKGGRIAATEVITIGSGNAIINGDGSIIVYDGADTVSNRDYALLTGGNLSFQRYRGGAYQAYKSVRRVVEGVANSGETVFIEGYWDAQPTVIVRSLSLQSFSVGNVDASQAWQIRADNLVETSVGSKRWKFDAIAWLTYLANNGSKVVSSAQSLSSSNTWTSATSTMPTNTVSTTVSVKLTSIRGNGTSTNNYLFRKVTWTIWTSPNNSTWTQIDTKVRVFSAAEHGLTVDDSLAVNIPAGHIYIQTRYVAADVGGTTPEYARAGLGNVYDYGLDGILTNSAEFTLTYGAQSATLYGPEYTGIPSGWSIYQVDYTVDWVNSASNGWSTFTSNGGYIYSAISDPGTMYGNTVSGTATVNLSASVYDPNFWSGSMSCSPDDGEVGSASGLSNPSAVVKYRRLQANSAAASNNYTFQSYLWAISGASALATGSLGYTVIGD